MILSKQGIVLSGIIELIVAFFITYRVSQRRKEMTMTVIFKVGIPDGI
jgi:hypothetical protein